MDSHDVKTHRVAGKRFLEENEAHTQKKGGGVTRVSAEPGFGRP